MAQYNIDEWNFSGDEEMNTTIGNTAISNQSTSYPGIFKGVVRLTSTDHGYKVSPDVYGPKPGNLIYVQGTTNYDGIRKIVAVAANTVDIVAKYVAETPAGTEILRPALKFNHKVEILGFDLHLDTASATAENLVFAVDADRGAAWDRTLWTVAMNGVQDVLKDFTHEDTVNRILEPGDILYVTWANTNDRLWGLKILTRRID